MLEGGNGFVHGVVIFAEGGSGCTWLRRLLGFGDVSSGFVRGIGDRAQELGNDVRGQFGVRFIEKFVKELIDYGFGFLKPLPAAFTGDLESMVPETLMLSIVRFDGGQGGEREMPTPGGGAFGPVVAGAEIAEGAVGLADG